MRAERLLEGERRREEQAWKEGIGPRPKPAPRYLNLAIADKSRATIQAADPLEADHDYLLRISIASREAASIVSTPKPFPTEHLLPDSTDGYWFDVMVVSSDVEVVPSAVRLFLPFGGASWVCACIGPEHTCHEDDRDRYLYVPFRTRAAGAAALRCTIYHRDNVVQSALVEVLVGAAEPRTKSQTAVIDYTLSADFAAVDLLEDRSLNVLTNESGQGTHKIVLKGSERAVVVDLPKATADGLLERGRAELRAVTLDRTGERSRYRTDNTQDTKSFIQDLKGLANVGAEFLVQVVPKRVDRSFLRDRLRTRSTMQIARVARSTSFPWALIYDLPVELDPEWKLCPLLDNWDLHRQLLDDLPGKCPFDEQHAEKNALCPFGFWGYRQIIEQPPSTAAPKKEIAPAPHAVAPFVRSLALNSRLSETHLKDLETCFERRFTLSDCITKDALSKLVAEPALPLIYFYCHGKEGEVGASEMPVPYLEIGKDDAIGARDFTTWGDIENWPEAHWTDVAPLVFINGCHTLKLTPETIVGFADVLADENAAGVIGTEISVAQETANEVAQRFWTYFAGERPVNVGEALYRTRIDLLKKGNVSGLVYTAFCLAELSLIEGVG